MQKATRLPSRKSKRIVVIGGGTGVGTVLSGLKQSGHKLSAIVTMADDGGSTGRLRKDFSILPPGDVRRALVALSHAEPEIIDLFAYRFQRGRGLEGHSFGNLLLTALERLTGSFERAIEEAGKLLLSEGEIIPVTLDRVRLRATLENGKTIFGEHVIDVPRRARVPIARIALVPRPKPNPRALAAIRRADLIVLGPGDLYTSLLPNLIVSGVASALRQSRAKKVFVVNVMTKFGETDGFTAKDFVAAVEDVIGTGVLDLVFVNTTQPTPRLRARYARREKAAPVAWSPTMFSNATLRVMTGSLLCEENMIIRHDAKKLGRALLLLLQ